MRKMKALSGAGSLCTILLAVGLLAVSAQAADYYVSSRGAAENPGTEVAPFSSVSQALDVAVAGDTVYLSRGDVFRESDLSVGADISITAYGPESLDKPAIQGSALLTSWTKWTENDKVLVADWPHSSDVGEVFVNNVRVTLARYPDSGWLRTDNNNPLQTTSNKIVCPELDGDPIATPGRWTGAQMRWRKWSWWYETRPIATDQGNGVLELGGSASGNNVGGLSGFYIDDTIKELDAPGEWYFDGDARKLYLYPPEDANPAAMRVEAAHQDSGLVLSGASLDGITVRHYLKQLITISSGSTVENCLLEHSSSNGIKGNWNCYGSTIRGNHIRDILNVGIWWNENYDGPGGTIIERNRLERIGAVAGLGGSGPWHAAGVIIVNAKALQFRLNRLSWTGYAGIILGREGQFVEKNVFRYCMSTLNDGGSIYTNCSRSTLRDNIILDTIGDLDSSQLWTPLGHGIWPEFLGNFEESVITGNTVYGSGGDGLFLPNNWDCVISDNIFLNNARAGMTLGGHENGRSDGMTNQNHVIENNICGIGGVEWEALEFRNLIYWADLIQASLNYRIHSDRDLDYGTMSGTTFVQPQAGDWIRDTSRSVMEIATWQSREPDWADPDPEVVVGDAYLFINDTETTYGMVLPADVSWTNLSETPVGYEVRIAPFRSVVLLATDGNPSNLKPYYLATEMPEPAGLPLASWVHY
ncbi:MAG: right-handed parallel beta-helix repeat-containing protein [Candidatus Sumerlaeia bacterium]